MPGISAGKSLMFRVTNTRPRNSAVARMIASGVFIPDRSRRNAAARSPTSASTSSMLKPESSMPALRSSSPSPFDITSIQTIRLTHNRPRCAARRSSSRASGNPRSVSISMLLSKVKPLTWQGASFSARPSLREKPRRPYPARDSPHPTLCHVWRTTLCEFRARGRRHHRTGPEIQPVH